MARRKREVRSHYPRRPRMFHLSTEHDAPEIFLGVRFGYVFRMPLLTRTW